MADMRKLIESIDSINEDLDEAGVQETYALMIRGDMSYEQFLEWVYDIRQAAKREVE